MLNKAFDGHICEHIDRSGLLLQVHNFVQAHYFAENVAEPIQPLLHNVCNEAAAQVHSVLLNLHNRIQRIEMLDCRRALILEHFDLVLDDAHLI